MHKTAHNRHKHTYLNAFNLYSSALWNHKPRWICTFILVILLPWVLTKRKGENYENWKRSSCRWAIVYIHFSHPQQALPRRSPHERAAAAPRSRAALHLCAITLRGARCTAPPKIAIALNPKTNKPLRQLKIGVISRETNADYVHDMDAFWCI